MNMALRHYILLSFATLFISHPVLSMGARDDIREYLTKNYTHEQIISALGDVENEDWPWRRTHIQQDKKNDECPEFDSLITKLRENGRLNIKELYISVQAIDPEELETLGEWLFRDDNTIKSLSIINSGLNNDMLEEGPVSAFMKKLSAWLRRNHTLEKLDLSGNPLGYSTALIIEAVKENKGLEKLILDRVYPQTSMFSETIESDLANNTTLKHFSFRDNKVDWLGWVDRITKRNSDTSSLTVDVTGTTAAHIYD